MRESRDGDSESLDEEELAAMSKRCRKRKREADTNADEKDGEPVRISKPQKS